MSEKRCYTVQELQEILGVSRPTIYILAPIPAIYEGKSERNYSLY